MSKPGELTEQEIRSQPASWTIALKRCSAYAESWRKIAETRARTTYFVGCGTSYYLAQAAAAAYRSLTGEDSRAVPASELLLFEQVYLSSEEAYLVFIISRSGTTTEAVKVAQKLAHRPGCTTVAITCSEGVALGQAAQHEFAFPEAFDRSVVMTRSFSSMLLALVAFASMKGGDFVGASKSNALEAAGEAVLRAGTKTANTLAGTFTNVVFLGQGPLYGIAREGSLKMKEMSLTTSEAFHSLEERHGPKSVVDSDTLVVVFSSEVSQAWEQSLIEELRGLGARCLQILEANRSSADYHIALQSGLTLEQRLPLYIVPCQLLALAHARSKNIDSDHPRSLAPVVAVALD